MINLECPHCRAELELPSSLCGQSETCPECRGIFSIPVIEAKISKEVMHVDMDSLPKGNWGWDCVCPNANCGYRGRSWVVNNKRGWVGSIAFVLLFVMLLLIFWPLAVLLAIIDIIRERRKVGRICPICKTEVLKGI